jgi:hypothetical protein
MSVNLPRSVLALFALLCSPLGIAATVTIVPPALTPQVGDTFTVTITADVPNTFAATMGLSFNAATVEYVSGVALSPWNVFVKNSPTTQNPTVFDVETPAATAANPGVYNVAELTFRVIAGGAANILINDDGGNLTGWFDADTADYIPNTYVQASIVIPSITVTDSVVPANDLLVPFGPVSVGTTSAPRTVTVRNNGSQNLLLGGVALANPLAPPYALVADTCSSQTLTPAATCTLTIDFSPVAEGPAPDDTFDIPSNDPTVTVSVSGDGVLVPVGDILVQDSVPDILDRQIPFGNVEVNPASPPTQTVTVTNNGNGNLTLGTVGSANPLAAPFSLGTNTCSGAVLTPASSCSFQVRFAPTVTGLFSDTLDVPSDDPDQPSVEVGVSGEGVPTAVADIRVSDSVNPIDDLNVPYGDVFVGSSATQTVTVTNDDLGDLVIGTVGGANSLAAPFSIVTDTCSGQTLGPADVCSVEIAFAPGAAQPFNDSFDIPSNDPDLPESPVTVQVGGTGAIAPVADITVTDSVSPNSDLQVPYGTVQVGSSTNQTVTVTNDGTGNLVLGTVGAANPLAVPFRIVTNGCSGQTLVPAGTCTVVVAFAPVAAQFSSDSFSIPSNDPDEATVTVAVNGTGSPVGVPGISVSDSTSPGDDLNINYGRVRLGSNARQTFTVTNAGTAPLVIGNVGAGNSLDPPFLIVANDCSGQTLAPGGSCAIDVTFEPDAVQPYFNSFDIPSSDPDDASVTVTVEGAGVSGGGSSAVDPATLLALGLLGFAAGRRAGARRRG